MPVHLQLLGLPLEYELQIIPLFLTGINTIKKTTYEVIKDAVTNTMVRLIKRQKNKCSARATKYYGLNLIRTGKVKYVRKNFAQLKINKVLNKH